MGALAAAVFALSIGAAAAAAPAPSRSPEEMRSLAREVVSAPDYQTSLPHPEDTAGVDAEEAERLRRGAAEPPRVEHELDVTPPSGALSVIASWLMYIVIAAVVLVLLFWLATELTGREKDVALGDGPAPEPGEDTEAVVARPLGDADALAREGRFAEAIHTLLLRTLEELVRRRATPLPRSLTSREILGKVALPDAARGALSGLVTATELCWFGGEAPGESDYQMCVERFRSFAAAYVSGVGAGPPAAARGALA